MATGGWFRVDGQDLTSWEEMFDPSKRDKILSSDFVERDILDRAIDLARTLSHEPVKTDNVKELLTMISSGVLFRISTYLLTAIDTWNLADGARALHEARRQVPNKGFALQVQNSVPRDVQLCLLQAQQYLFGHRLTLSECPVFSVIFRHTPNDDLPKFSCQVRAFVCH